MAYCKKSTHEFQAILNQNKLYILKTFKRHLFKRQRKNELPSASSLSNTHKGQDWAGLKLGARRAVRPPTWVAETQLLESSPLPLRVLTGRKFELGAGARNQTYSNARYRCLNQYAECLVIMLIFLFHFL